MTSKEAEIKADQKNVAKIDMRIARVGGYMFLGITRLGSTTLKYNKNSKRYSINTQGNTGFEINNLTSALTVQFLVDMFYW